MDGLNDMEPTPGTKLTYDDFVNFPDDGLRHELIDGEHYVTPSPATRHQRLVGRLHGALFNHFEAHRSGEVFVAPFDVVLSTHDVVEPDLLVILADQPAILTPLHVRGAPAVVIEVLSPGTNARDRGVKHALYARTGVREYWLVDPTRSVVVQCARDADGALVTARELSLSAHSTLASDLLPGLALPLAMLFA